MHPTKTIYRLARAGGEYNKLYAMHKRQAGERANGFFTFPTIVAERDGEVLGFLGTWKHDRAVICGPLVLRDGPNAIMTFRLLDAYERVLRKAGVRAYITSTEPGNKNAAAFLEGLGFERKGLTRDGEVAFYRELA